MTTFANVVQPWPDWYTVEENLRLFRLHGVSGVFMEGQYSAYGGDMQELKTWVNQKLMWGGGAAAGTNSTDRLVARFLNAWMCGDGRLARPCDAAAALQRHMKIFLDSFKKAKQTDPYTREHGLRESAPVDSAYLTPRALLGALSNLRNASRAVTSSHGRLPAATVLERIQRVELGTLYVVLLRWEELRAWAGDQHVPWPIEASLDLAFDRFAAWYVRFGMEHRVGFGPDGPDEGLSAGGGHGLQWLNKTIHARAPAEAWSGARQRDYQR
jgi:hypothetical protein